MYMSPVLTAATRPGVPDRHEIGSTGRLHEAACCSDRRCWTWTSYPFAMNLVDLPDELLAQIASLLDAGALVRLQQVSTRFHVVVQSNVALQYAIELDVAGMVDNPASRLVPAERLRILRQKEESWRTIDLSDRRVLSLQHNPSGIYDLTGGVLLLGERRNAGMHTGTDSVHTVHLHSAFRNAAGDARPLPLWRTIDLGQQVIDVGLAIQEHDLIAIVTYK